MPRQIPAAGELRAALEDARRSTLALVEDLDDAELEVPLLPIVNPFRWELGHVAWFQEKWLLRHLRGEPAIDPGGDALYDSAAVPHDTRWSLPLPDRKRTLGYMDQVLERVLARLGPLEERSRYFHELALFHEDMHGEAFVMMRQTLGRRVPQGIRAGASTCAPARGGWIDIAGGSLELGAEPGPGFVFDNEKWSHPVEVRPFRIAREAVTAGEFAAFVADGGYAREDLWSPAGWAWRSRVGALHPVYWQRDAQGGWLRRVFDRWVPLEPHLPVMHVSWFEAESYCRWAGVRLPGEAEWELAASGVLAAALRPRFPWGDTPDPASACWGGDSGGPVGVADREAGDSPAGCRQMVGNVWEWTADDFAPYPGFAVDPYKEYSEPWFGTHKVLRGGSWWTRPRLLRLTWRNFYTPERRDPFNGFRVCAL